ncbi:hypothetical protein ACHAWT_001435, partial [Skeletonema menzelii]
ESRHHHQHHDDLSRYSLHQKKPKNIGYLLPNSHHLSSSNMSEEPKTKNDVFEETGGLRRPKKSQPKTCYHCGRPGHISRDCTNEEATGQMRENITKEKHHYRRCFNCGRFGHISADCTKAAGNKCCYNCGKEGHIAKECSETRAEN